MSPWLKAGLIGAVVLVVLNLLGLIPLVGCLTWILALLACAGIGALAAYFMTPLRETGSGAGQGALAAGLAALIGGLVNTLIVALQMSVTDTSAMLSQIPPESLDQLEAAGIDPAMFMGPTAGLLYGGLCCIGFLFLAVILGAIGGAIFAAIKSE